MIKLLFISAALLFATVSVALGEEGRQSASQGKDENPGKNPGDPDLQKTDQRIMDHMIVAARRSNTGSAKGHARHKSHKKREARESRRSQHRESERKDAPEVEHPEEHDFSRMAARAGMRLEPSVQSG